MFKGKISACIDLRNGIGRAGRLPWSLAQESVLYKRLIHSGTLPNLVIKGRVTSADSPPEPRSNCREITITRAPTGSERDLTSSNFEEAECMAAELVEKGEVGTVWAVGGESVFEEALQSPNFTTVHLTRIQHDFGCDRFFPLDKILDCESWSSETTFELKGDKLLAEDAMRGVVETEANTNDRVYWQHYVYTRPIARSREDDCEPRQDHESSLTAGHVELLSDLSLSPLEETILRQYRTILLSSALSADRDCLVTIAKRRELARRRRVLTPRVCRTGQAGPHR